jgi:RNA recognition motif-containing protein
LTTTIYVGNLGSSTTSDDLKYLFDVHGDVLNAEVITDHGTGRACRFGFIELSSLPEAESAVAALDGTRVGDRRLTVATTRQRRG